MKKALLLIIFNVTFGFSQQIPIGKWLYQSSFNDNCFSPNQVVKSDTNIYIHFIDSTAFESNHYFFKAFKKYTTNGYDVTFFSDSEDLTCDFSIHLGKLSIKKVYTLRNYIVFVFN